MRNFKKLYEKAQSINSRSIDTEIGFEIKCDNSTMDYTDSLDKAKEIVKSYKEIGATGMWIKPIVIDIYDGETITEKNLAKHNRLVAWEE